MKKHPIDYLEQILDELHPTFADLIADQVKRSAREQGLEAGGDLIKSIRAQVIPAALKLQREVVGELNFYGRYHDLKYLEYGAQWITPNNKGKKYGKQDRSDEAPQIVVGLEYYIRKNGGMAAFKWAEDRFSMRKKLTEDQKIRRTAWILAAAKLQQNRTMNPRRKKWYTQALSKIRNAAASQVREMTARKYAEYLKGELDSSTISL